MFVPWAEVLLQAAAPRPGERVLDLACGTGIVARQLAPRLGPAGEPGGARPAPTMLAVARSHPAPAGARHRLAAGGRAGVDPARRRLRPGALPAGAAVLRRSAGGPARGAAGARPRRARRLRRLAGPVAPGGVPGLVAAELRHLAPLGITAAHAAAPFVLGDPAELRRCSSGPAFPRVEVARARARGPLRRPPTLRARAELAYASVMPEYLQQPAAFRAYVAGHRARRPPRPAAVPPGRPPRLPHARPPRPGATQLAGRRRRSPTPGDIQANLRGSAAAGGSLHG